jgi:hypothetical protein
MAVLELSIPTNLIDNNRTSVGLPPTGPSVAPNYRLEFGYELPSPADSAAIVTNFNTKLDNRFFNQLFINGGTA